MVFNEQGEKQSPSDREEQPRVPGHAGDPGSEKKLCKKVLRILVDSKSTCATNVPSGQTRPTVLVCIRRSAANRSHEWRDITGRSSSGQPNAAVVGRFGHTGVSRMKSHHSIKRISTGIGTCANATHRRNAGFGFKC